MKNMRRIFSMLLVMAMVLTFALPSMTAKADESKDMYEVYQILTGNLNDGQITSAEYGMNCIKEQNIQDILTALKAVKNGTDQQKLEVILQYTDLDSTPFDTVEADAGMPVTINNLPAGYYLIKNVTASQGNGEAYGLYVAKVTSGTLWFSPKVSAPTLEKEVNKENANIGDPVTFALVATMSDRLSDFDTYKLKFTDTMSKGLTLDKNSFVVKVNNQVITEQFEISAVVDEDGVTHISVACVDILKISPKINNGDKITVNYTAELNKDAVIGSEGNDNTVKLEYSNNPNITQDDLDGDGIPNDEDPDIDGDGTPNDTDNDDDNDKIPDDKDPDDDNDGIPDGIDPGYNPDGDDDGDTIPNDEDKDHPAYDTDGDGIPDIIDPDDDNDGVLDKNDDDDKNDSWTDSDGDGVPDVIDPDPNTPAPGDSKEPEAEDDFDGDGIPDSEDPDIDGDKIPNGEDPDDDNDGIPDVMDPDDDNDGTPDDEDPDGKFDGNDTSDTPKDEVEVTTGAIKVIKTNEKGEKLTGVEFVLVDTVNKKIANVDSTTGTLISWDNYTEGGSYDGYELTTKEGVIEVKGLADGTYQLIEIKALPEYNPLTGPVSVTVSDAQTIQLSVINYPGTTLPETGGIGTTIFYVLGGLMVAGAAVLLVTKKRMGNE